MRVVVQNSHRWTRGSLSAMLVAGAVAVAFAGCATASAPKAAPGPAAASPPSPSLVVRCPREALQSLPGLDAAVRAVRRLRILHHYVIAQGRVRLTVANSPVVGAESTAGTTMHDTSRFRRLLVRKCGREPLEASWLMLVSFPTLLAGSGLTPFVVTDTRHGWVVSVEEKQ